MSTKDCLQKAINIMSAVGDDVIPREWRDQIVDSMKAVLDSADNLDANAAIARMEAAARGADTDARRAAFSQAAQKVKDPELDARYTGGDPLVQGPELRQSVDPLPGNRGAADQSFMTRVRGEVGRMQGQLSEIMPRLYEGIYIRPTKYADDLRRGLLGLDVDDPQVAIDVKVIRETFTPYIKRLKEGGTWVDEIDNWWMRDWDLARMMTHEKRFDELLARGLNRKTHPDPGATAARMKASLSQRDVSGSKNLGIGMRRKLDFADPEIEFIMMKEFGRGDMSAQMQRVIETLASEVSAVEQFGPLWRQSFPRLAKKIAEDGNLANKGILTKSGRVLRQLDHAEAVMIQQSGDLTRAANMTKGNIAAGLQNLVTAVKLGLTPTWQVTMDPVLGVLGAPRIQGNVFRRVTGQLTRAFELMTSEDMRQALRMQGVWRDTASMQGSSRLPFLLDPATQLGVGETGTRSLSQRFLNSTTQLATMTLRGSLSNLIENFNRSSVHAQTMVALLDNFPRRWEDLPPRVRKWDFEANGLGKKEWDSIRRSPEGDFKMPDFEELALRDPQTHRRLMGMLHRESEMSIIRSDASDRVWLTLRTTPGSAGNIGLSMLTQFMAWNTKMARGPLVRSWHQGTSPFVAYSAGLVLSTMLGMQLRAAVTGQPLFDMENPRSWWEAFLRSGVLGPFAEPLINTITPGERIDVPGAVPSTLAKLTRLGIGSFQDQLNDEAEKAALKRRRIAVEAIPNWWQWEWFIRSTMEEVTWELDPQSANARERILEKQGRKVE